jgi:hypothetical protein
MDDPCPNSSRDDGSKDFQGTSTVSLPDGCSNAGPHDSSIHWSFPTNYFAEPGGPWGFCDPPQTTCAVDFRYNMCSWVCEISNVQVSIAVYVGNPDNPQYVSITNASDVPCGENNSEALLAKSDLNDSDLTDAVGALLTKYWIHLAICVHEEKHRTDWESYYGPALNTAITMAETITVNIDCDVPYTCTCQGAESYWSDQIAMLFDWAWNHANDLMDDPSTPDLDEAEVRAYLEENTIEQPVSNALPEGCTP